MAEPPGPLGFFLTPTHSQELTAGLGVPLADPHLIRRPFISFVSEPPTWSLINCFHLLFSPDTPFVPFRFFSLAEVLFIHRYCGFALLFIR